MTNHSTYFQATASGLVLTNAILLYQADAGADPGQTSTPAFASIHKVEVREGRPEIAAGAPLSREHLAQWSESLGKAASPEILPENVLVAHPDVLAWWVPEQIRPAYFHLSKPGADLRAIAQRVAVPVPYPAHLFVARRGQLGVYALPTNCRPGPNTPVLHSPILNVFLNGNLCWGNIAQPRTLTFAAMAEYETAVFDSWSTHPNPGQELTVSSKGGLVKLWDDLAARRAQRFPVHRMKPFNPSERRQALAEPITLRKLVAGSAR